MRRASSARSLHQSFVKALNRHPATGSHFETNLAPDPVPRKPEPAPPKCRGQSETQPRPVKRNKADTKARNRRPSATALHSYFYGASPSQEGTERQSEHDPGRGIRPQSSGVVSETSVARAWSTRAGHRLDFYPVRHPGQRRRRNPNPVCCGCCPSRDGTLLYKRRFQAQ